MFILQVKLGMVGLDDMACAVNMPYAYYFVYVTFVKICLYCNNF